MLIELLQNAHDAHPAGRSDGRVEILLHEDEGALRVHLLVPSSQPWWRRMDERMARQGRHHQGDPRTGVELDRVGEDSLTVASVVSGEVDQHPPLAGSAVREPLVRAPVCSIPALSTGLGL